MPRPLKIAVVVGVFPVVSQTFIINQINTLIDAGHQVSIYAYRKGTKNIVHHSLNKHHLLNRVIYFEKHHNSKLMRIFQYKKWIIKNIFVVKWLAFFKSINVFKYGKEALSLGLFFESQWFLKHTDFDVIHTHFGQNARRIAYLKSLGFIPNKTKLVTTFHGYDLKPNNTEFYKNKYAILFKQSNAFTVNTIYLKNILNELQPQLNNIHLLPVGLDTTYFKRQHLKTDSTYFDLVFCGRLIALKAPDIAIDIIHELHKLGYTQVRLHIIGTGTMQTQLEDKIKVFNLEASVFLVGDLIQRDIIQLYEQADAFLFPGIKLPETGLAETQGLVLQEAQAMELPVIVSDVGGMKYGLIPNETGFLIQEKNSLAFVKAIESLILNPDLKKEMGSKARAYVCDHFDNEILRTKLVYLYNKVVASA